MPAVWIRVRLRRRLCRRKRFATWTVSPADVFARAAGKAYARRAPRFTIGSAACHPDLQMLVAALRTGADPAQEPLVPCERGGDL